MDDGERDRAWAHALARLTLGINIALHGLGRVGHIRQFALELRNQFGPTLLPGPLVELSGYGIVLGELCIGILLVLGLWLRSVLIAGLFLMMVLQFGTCVRQDWTTAGTQLIYVGFYALLLGTLRHDRFSAFAHRSQAA